MAAYNNYYPVSYSPFGQPIYPQAQQPQAIQNPSPSGIIWISGLQEAQMYPLAPNNAVALWEQNGKTVYLKSADATGRPSMRIYDLVERTDAGVVQTADSVNTYATKEELSTVAGAIKTALSDIEQMKSDLYGVAGRKKPSKKVEAEDDDD